MSGEKKIDELLSRVHDKTSNVTKITKYDGVYLGIPHHIYDDGMRYL